MPRMTDEEADALDELATKYPPKVSGDGKSGFFMKYKGTIVILDDVSATWLRMASEAARKSPSELVNEMVREKMALAQRIKAVKDKKVVRQIIEEIRKPVTQEAVEYVEKFMKEKPCR